MSILFRPVVTEKATIANEKLNRFSFIVERSANKIQIKKAVENMYNVIVEKITTMKYFGKTKSRNTKTGVKIGRKNHYKKATVTLKQGEKIDFYKSV